MRYCKCVLLGNPGVGVNYLLGCRVNSILWVWLSNYMRRGY